MSALPAWLERLLISGVGVVECLDFHAWEQEQDAFLHPRDARGRAWLEGLDEPGTLELYDQEEER